VSVHRRGDRWVARVYLGRHPDTGRAKWSFSTYRTQKEAKRAEAEVRTRLHKGTYVAASRQTVAAYLRDWLNAAKIDLRPSTQPAYEIAIEKHLIPRVGSLPLQKLTPHHLTWAYGELLEKGRCDGTGGLSPRTVRFIHTVVRKALQDAVDARLLEWNPAANAKPPKAKTAEEAARKKRRYWDASEVRRFLASVRDNRLQAAFHLATTTGMRRGEVLGLRWRDVDLDGARLVVEQTLLITRTATDGVPWKYQLVFSEPKTSHGRRSIDLDEETVAVLLAHRKRQIEEQLALGPDYPDSELVFRTPDGQPIMPELFSQAFKKAVKDAGLPPIRLHDLRHSHIALLAKAGVAAKVIQERAGHHSAGFTLDNYGGTFPSQHQEAARAFAALVRGTS
jgi:integrase